MALFSLTVTSAKVAASETDMPLYVDLAEMPAAFWSVVSASGGDIRCYSDEAKTTELAREVVSCDTATDTGALHVKIPSLTTSTVIYIDVDGTRTEPASTATYGSEAVWSDYEAVFHFREGSGTTAANSTGGTDGTLTSADLWGTNAPFGSSIGISPDGTNYITTGISGTISNYSISDWRYNTDPAGVQNARYFWGGANTFTSNSTTSYFDDGNPVGAQDTLREYRASTHVLAQTTASLDVWQYRVRTSQKNATNGAKDYRNASVIQQANTPNSDISLSTRAIYIGALNNTGTVAGAVPAGNHISEWRCRLAILSADWITTEYNNQSDVAGFWTIAEVQTQQFSAGFFAVA